MHEAGYRFEGCAQSIQPEARDMCGLRSVSYDAELEVLHEQGEPTLMVAKHVDDLKIAGTESNIKLFLAKLEAVFGALTVHWDSFTNCGVKRHLDIGTRTITLDQSAYIAALKPIVHSDLSSRASEELLTGQLYTMFRSLLGDRVV